MSQDRDDTPKGDRAKPVGGGKPMQDKPGDVGKRPYATLDLKAVELPGDKASVIKVASAAAASAAAAGLSDAVSNAEKTTDAKPQVSAQAKAGAAAVAGTVPPKSGQGTAGVQASMGAAGKASPAPAKSAAVGSWMSSLVAGAAGAILALLGLGSLGLIGGDLASNGLAERLAALEKAASEPSAGDFSKKLTSADARFAAVEAAAKQMAEAQAALTAEAKALDARLAGQASAGDRVQKLEQQLKDLAAAAETDPQRGRIPALAQLTSRIGDLDTQLTTRASSLKTEISQDLEQRLAKSAETAEAARARLAQRTQSLEQTLKSVADDTSALRGTVDGLKGDLDARLRATAKPADVTAAIEPVTTKIAGLEKNLANVVRSEQDRNATAGNILLSIELGNLKRAIDRGGRYAPELAAVKKVGGDKLNLAVLEGAQASGVPSLAALTTEFRALAYTMLDAEADPDQGSVVDRLLASAKSVVRVRKVQHSADDKGTEATVGRMEGLLKEGRLADVLDLSKTLADKPLAVAAPWLKKIEARNAIETALTDLDQSLKNALAGSAQVQKGAN